MRAAIIENGVVVNVARVADQDFADQMGWVVSDEARIGDSYNADTGEFTSPPPEPQPEPNYFTYKTDIWQRCTDAEAETLDGALSQATAKERRMWEDSLTIEHSSDYYDILRAEMIDRFGEARTDVILAPSSEV
ncbi:hypothetical protein [Modicisalibacter coralii]|uniref:hypothetical protein n=1 Tax=Modicisalibacter coralii TaxID=2304602 RepID=UPI00100AECA8|nr:hypothetical protein [Halomonas coralii]